MRLPLAFTGFALAAALSAGAAPAADAQSFSGDGPQATADFPLPNGLAVFEFSITGSEAFTVRLFAIDGTLIDTVAHGTAPLRGSRAVQIARAGRYLLDVSASDSWEVGLRPKTVALSGGPSREPAPTVEAPAPASASAVREAGGQAGYEAAERQGNFPWLLGGLAGGAALGPIGAGAVYVFASSRRDSVRIEQHEQLADRPPEYVAGFREAYARNRRTGRRVAAAVGGITGTVIFGFVVAQIVNWANESGGGGNGNGDRP